MHSNTSKLLLPTTIGALIIANSAWAFEVSQSTFLDRDYHEAFVFTASGVELDCNHHTILGDGLTLTGIQRATVRNCFITNFDRGYFSTELRTARSTRMKCTTT